MNAASTHPAPDPLLAADHLQAADVAASEALLRCWVRETRAPVPPAGASLELVLPASGVTLGVPVLHRSETDWHRFGRPRFAASGALAGAPAVAGLLAAELAARGGLDPAATGDLATRALLSAERVAVHLRARRADPADPSGECSFLAGEQALLLGHPFHPAPKSRPGASDTELSALSPELRGAVALHWFAAHPSVAAGGSASTALDPFRTARALAVGVDVPAGWVAIPAHPWQARDVAQRRGIAELLEGGLLRDLGPGAEVWQPTSSVRTVFRDGAPVMLKLSLGLRITNSRRENLRGELLLGLRAHSLMDALEPSLRAAHPGFRVLRDPAWLAVEPAGCGNYGGLEVALRENPFGAGDRVVCLAGLLAERPAGGSRLAGLLRHAAGGDGRGTVTHLALTWVERFVQSVVAPVAWLLDTHGLGLEAHAQNLLVALDADGFPAGGWYRDNQGFYVAARHAERARAAVPDLEDGVRAVFDDELVEDRVAYYLGVNALLGLVGALGAEQLADERELLHAARGALQRHAAGHPGGLAARLIEAPALPCKANLLTCADGRDELDGPVETQSLYLDVRNPLVAP